MSAHRSRCAVDPRRASALLALTLLVLAAAPAHAVVRTWLSATSGSAGTSTLWTTNGLPAAGDNIVVSPAGVYSISFPVASVPLVISHDYRNGAIVTLTSDGVHSTTSSFGIDHLSSAAVDLLGGSTFNPATFFMGGTSTSYGRLTMNSSGIPSLSPVFQQADSNNGSIIGGSDKARLEVLGGSTFLADGYAIFGNGTTAVCTLIVSGRNAIAFTNSAFQTTNPRKGNLLFGNVGSAFGRVDNGAFMRLKGDVTMGAGVNGRATMRIGTSTSTFNPSFYAEKTLRIADRGFPGGQGGGAEFWLSRGFAGIGGLCTLGDPDGNTALANLRVDGGTLRMSGGFTRNSGTTFDHLGGTIHFPDGQITWPGFDWNVTSTVGTPLLWFANSRVTDDVTHMNVGRSGAGTLRATQPGTQLLLSGSLTVGDSTGGSGTVELDSSASVTSRARSRTSDRRASVSVGPAVCHAATRWP